MSCQHFRMEIEDTDRATPLGARAAAHIAACAACREFSAGRESLRRLVGGLDRVEAPADFEFRLRARIARAEGARDAGFARRSFVPGAAWLAVAACAVLALGMFIHLRQAPGQAPSAQPGGESPREVAATQAQAVSPAAQTAEALQTSVEQASVESQASTGTAARARVQPQKNGARRARFVLAPDTVQQLAANQRGEDSLETNNLSIQGTRIYAGSPIPLPVTTPDRPLEALFKDAQGASRVVSVDPVTFGARSLPSRRTSARTISYNQGVW